MKFGLGLAAGILGFLQFARSVHAADLLESHALIPCAKNNIVSVNKFDVVFTPDNHTVEVGFHGSTSYSGNVMLEVQVLVYGYLATTQYVNPCDFNVHGLCPVKPTTLHFPFTRLSNVPTDALSKIPGESELPRHPCGDAAADL